MFVTRKLFPDPDDLLSTEGAKEVNVLHPAGLHACIRRRRLLGRHRELRVDTSKWAVALYDPAILL